MKTLIEVKDKNSFKILTTIERSIRQNTNGGIMRVTYNKQSFVVYGGFRNNYFICV